MLLHEKKFEVLNYVLNTSSLLRQLTSGCEEYTTTEGHVIEPAKSVRDLGVLSSDRSWSPHIEQTVQSGRKMPLWSINTVTSLEAFKVALGEYLRRIPDTPPVPGYTAVNRNSLLDWSNEKGGRT
ncbi:unnamed protein product [Boreogadus saida]